MPRRIWVFAGRTDSFAGFAVHRLLLDYLKHLKITENVTSRENLRNTWINMSLLPLITLCISQKCFSAKSGLNKRTHFGIQVQVTSAFIVEMYETLDSKHSKQANYSTAVTVTLYSYGPNYFFSWFELLIKAFNKEITGPKCLFWAGKVDWSIPTIYFFKNKIFTMQNFHAEKNLLTCIKTCLISNQTIWELLFVRSTCTCIDSSNHIPFLSFNVKTVYNGLGLSADWLAQLKYFWGTCKLCTLTPSTMIHLTNQGKEISVWFIPFNRNYMVVVCLPIWHWIMHIVRLMKKFLQMARKIGYRHRIYGIYMLLMLCQATGYV